MGRALRLAVMGAPVGGGGVGVADLSLPASNLLAWWYAGNGSSVPDDVTTDGDGQAATAWADKSATGYDLTKAGAGTATYRQTVVALNSRGAVEFDGASYFVRNIASSIAAGLTAFNIFIVYVNAAISADEAIYSEGRSSSGTPMLKLGVATGAPDGSGRVAGYCRDNAGTDANIVSVGGNGAVDGTSKIETLRRIASNSWSLRLNGTETATSAAAPGAITIDRVALGALVRSDIGQYLSGQLACVAVYSADNYATIEPLLAAHYGVTLPG